MLPLASYNLPSRAPQRLVNVWPQKVPAKDGVELVSVPGTVTAVALTGVGRGLHVMGGQLYAVAGETLYLVSATGTATALGTVPGTERLWITDNGLELVTSTAHVWNGTRVAAIADPDRPAWGAIDSIDGYVVYVESGTQRWGASDLYAATSYDALQYASAEGSGDRLVSLVVDHRQIALLGQSSIELWYDSGQSGFPFERVSGGYLEIGALAPQGVCKGDNSIWWLASDRTIRRLTGSVPQRVSQHGVENAIAEMATVEDCQAFSFTWQGNVLVCFRFPTEGQCFVFNATVGEWHERQSYGSLGWDIVDAAEAYGRVYV
jgi:hypothetical protein